MSIADTPTAATRPVRFALDKLGVMIALIAAAGAALPFALFRANRIVLGETKALFEALPGQLTALLTLTLLAGFGVALLRLAPLTKLIVGFSVLAVLFVLMGQSAAFLTPEGNTFARVSPGAGFWLLVFAFALLVTDALTRLAFKPLTRVAILIAVAAAMALLLWSGGWDQLSMLKEYANRAPAFWSEARTHLVLAFGSVAIATLVGLPLGIVCYKVKPLRAGVLNVLNIVQTIPSIALFGLLIAPLAWIAANIPGASAIGISGIGTAPALVALFAYSLLPIVSNTVVGLQSVSPAAIDAARGMGMTDFQRLRAVELPLAFPVILTGIRIVLVQNIGLTTIAALIGGGGFGVFVFQGIGQTAMDLVLLGAVPTVALAFAAAVVLDALVEMTAREGKRS
ncbi:ABC transporter permease [Devosia neptuniae]|jgi:osmoprotectant transport system permease protein|uniref:ABC transporter permease n=1 Tax=Devosia TaxID=46913 RepID=UPI0022AFBE96|nr:ABC transporter permease [Devosia neptuniae]MCZ4344810.1 ABC transporter permease [Devosia neptuniae]|tara:strand:- start:5461 stop:6654 length:1194 start_codon:yes stop_codon:yes gene_type:complete